MEVWPAHALATRLSFFKLKQTGADSKMNVFTETCTRSCRRASPARQGQCGEAPVHAYAAIDVIDWAGAVATSAGGHLRDPAQLNRITPGSTHI
jgi:hypothetical protein